MHSENKEKKPLRSKVSHHAPHGSILISVSFEVFLITAKWPKPLLTGIHWIMSMFVPLPACLFLISEEPLVIQGSDSVLV